MVFMFICGYERVGVKNDGSMQPAYQQNHKVASITPLNGISVVCGK